MNLQPIFNIAEICHQHGLKDVVLSPGSRCAPLTLAFTRHPEMNCKTISDERSAGFIALGMSQITQLPSTLICTSGSAAYNYAPAVAEAFFQQVPLLILTADRPPEWLDQFDGQTIHQEHIYGSHVKKSYSLPADLSNEDAEWHCYRIVSEAINEAKRYPQGPVHINIPLREPFYPRGEEGIIFNKEVPFFLESPSNIELPLKDLEQLIDTWKNTQRKLIIGGQEEKSEEIINLLDHLSENQKVPFLGDVISNLHDAEHVISHSDIFLGQGKSGLHESLQPEMIVTFGKSVISKNLKLFLRKFKPKVHWHIQPAGPVADTYKSLTKIIRTHPYHLLKQLSALEISEDFNTQKQENFYRVWEIEERKTRRFLSEFFPQEPLGEFEIIKRVLDIAEHSNIHLSNSMAVRYANFIGIKSGTYNLVFANRGTSGIDGCSSTAVGSVLASTRKTLLITGDLAFFYDRNAFWHNYPLKNLKILLLNNHAGGIFRIINGPSEQPELEEYFETKQKLNAKSLADEFSIHYIKCDRRSKLKNQLKEFWEIEDPVILELESNSAENKEILDQFKTSIKTNS